jgi:hypothetical protein
MQNGDSERAAEDRWRLPLLMMMGHPGQDMNGSDD